MPHACRLVLIRHGASREIALENVAALRFGRDPGSDVVLADTGISRHHARLERRADGRHLLLDAGSRNGIRVNGARLSGARLLSDQDRFWLGPFEFVYHAPLSIEDGVTLSGVQDPTAVDVRQAKVIALAVDVREFSALAQQMDALALANLVGAFAHGASAIFDACGATHRQAAGDGFLALWAPEQLDGRSCTQALQAAGRLSQLAEQAATPLRIGVGIATGTAVVGPPGHPRLGDNTALGEAVNRAFRLETATRTVPCDCLMDEGAWALLDVAAPNAGLTLHLKSYATPVRAYALAFEEIAAAWPHP